MDNIETIVIGAGVVGLACAAALAKSGRDVLVLEKNLLIGEEVSARNSEVIHAGIYYPTNSLKARLCVRGKELLYQYCAERHITHRRLGKLIVATSDEDIVALEKLLHQGQANGVEELQWLNTDAAKKCEPALQCKAALFSGSTGIVDSHGLMVSLQGDLESNGGMISFDSQVERILRSPVGYQLDVFSGGETFSLLAKELVNCAGLDAVALAHSQQSHQAENDDMILPQARYAKGNYFKLVGKVPFTHLIYPAPVPGGLGIHLTMDLNGCARFGPDVEPVGSPDVGYAVDPERADSFYSKIRKYWPGLPDHCLTPDYCGIRPKIWRDQNPPMDFEILCDFSHHNKTGNQPKAIHCLGIESPGLTSSLAIAEEVSEKLGPR